MFGRFLKSNHGVIAVETALMIGFVLAPMMLGLWDAATIAIRKGEVDEALQAVITYVAAGNASNSSGIVAASQAAYGSNINVSTSTACYCVSTSASPTIPTVVSCTGSCANGADLEQFMNISVTSTVAMPVSVPYLGSTVTVTSSAQVRTG
jgi:Flp pilus assembly protein TadG